MKTLHERLTDEQKATIAKEAEKYPQTGKTISKALKKQFIIDLTVQEAINITSALNKGLGEIMNIFK